MKRLAKEIMRRDISFIKKEAKIDYILKKIKSSELKILMVIDDYNHPIGIITDTDILFKEADLDFPNTYSLLGSIIFTNLSETKDYKEKLRKEVAIDANNLMSKNLIMGDINSTVHDICNLMINNNVSHIPIVNDDNEVIGIVTKKEIIEIIIDNYFD
ncbi:MAG: CBS domain-containing protein [Peptostreptococcaceae bacterium]|jgi:predicted transcriptional regulator|nr:CBS domain-containing protein [Peptostreptococcaceae bacterium]